MDSGQLYDAVIVGGGLAGTTVAAELALSAPPGFRALLIEASEPGPGSAYAPASDRLYMNGTALAMSAAAADKRDLVRWLRNVPDNALISRRLFGRYLSERFRAAVSQRPEFEIARSEVVDLIPHDDGFTVVDAQGGQRTARDVILALGNFPPDYSFLPAALHRHPGFVADPWRFDPTDAIASKSVSDVLIIGGGLTAMDTATLFFERGFRGRTHMVSRHGLTPCVDNPFARALDPQTLELDTTSARTMVRTLRVAAQRHMRRGGDWREVVESIRAMSPAVWSGWPMRERRRFLRHVAAFWAVHRYRVPPKTAALCERLRRDGRLVRYRGRVASAAETPAGFLRVEIAGAVSKTAVAVSLAINCVGPNGDYERVRHPLVAALLRRGLIRPDPLHLGLDATHDLRVVDASGVRSPHLWALGPPLRGIWYETTAVPETREQAARIATFLVEEFSAGRLEAAS